MNICRVFIFLNLLLIVSCTSKNSTLSIEKNFVYQVFEIKVIKADKSLSRKNFKVALIRNIGPIFNDMIFENQGHKSCIDCDFGKMQNGEMILKGFGTLSFQQSNFDLGDFQVEEVKTVTGKKLFFGTVFSLLNRHKGNLLHRKNKFRNGDYWEIPPADDGKVAAEIKLSKSCPAEIHIINRSVYRNSRDFVLPSYKKNQQTLLKLVQPNCYATNDKSFDEIVEI